mmetsp:Transcript_37779/g.55729  ORF Transcript_37779/g.55729 Transcript_37779/m.55729 type:complete len:485 (+) Transcript_37779:92-1546(+)|eukprot:scaffold9623_cov140-Skeletonema_dohrnii-CCMP3373.AAC.4
MKRAANLGSNERLLKRANSSLFSIATLLDNSIEEGNAGESVEQFTSLNCVQVGSCSGVDNNDSPPDEEAPDDGYYVGCSEDSEEANSMAVVGGRINGDSRTAVVFEAAEKHFDRHNKFHKERPARILSVRDYLSKSTTSSSVGKTILERCHDMSDESGTTMCLDEEDYLRVHLPGYMQILDRTSCCCNDRLDDEAEQYKSIYLTNDSVEMAKIAASSLCRLVGDVVRDKYDNGFAVIRPPGHHAEPGYAGGYCFINNVAVAASYAIERLPIRKVLIVDWDVHHGNGTQKAFLDDPNVLYFSIHRFDNGNFFPFSKDAGPRIVGNGDGEGRNVNVGWNDKRMGDDEYLVVFEKLLMPIATEFDPDLVLVSAGFDASAGDMGDCNVTPECFGRLTRQLKTLAGGKVVCALEGGYVRSILCKCVESVVLVLLDGASDDKYKDETKSFYKNLGDKEMLDCIDSSAAKSIRETMTVHSQYWQCLKKSCK